MDYLERKHASPSTRVMAVPSLRLTAVKQIKSTYHPELVALTECTTGFLCTGRSHELNGSTRCR